MQGSRDGHHGPSPQGRAWRILLTVGQTLVRALDAEMQKGVGLDLQRYDVMLHVFEGVGGRRMTELARAVVLSKSGLTALVDRMEADGLLERRPDPTDRRATRVVLTGEGESRFREASSFHREVVHRIFIDRVTEEEALVMAEALARIRRELGEEGGNEKG